MMTTRGFQVSTGAALTYPRLVTHGVLHMIRQHVWARCNGMTCDGFADLLLQYKQSDVDTVLYTMLPKPYCASELVEVKGL